MRIIVLNRPTFPTNGVYGTFTNSRAAGKEVELCNAQQAADYTRSDYPKNLHTGYAYSFKVIQGTVDQVFVPSGGIDQLRCCDVRTMDTYDKDVIAQLHILIDDMEKDAAEKTSVEQPTAADELDKVLKEIRQELSRRSALLCTPRDRPTATTKTPLAMVAVLCGDPDCAYCKQTLLLIADYK